MQVICSVAWHLVSRATAGSYMTNSPVIRPVLTTTPIVTLTCWSVHHRKRRTRRWGASALVSALRRSTMALGVVLRYHLAERSLHIVGWTYTHIDMARPLQYRASRFLTVPG